MWILFYILYVCIFSIPQSQWNGKQCDKGCKEGRNSKEWLQNSSFSLLPNVTPSLWTLLLFLPSAYMPELRLLLFSPKGLSRFLWYFLTSICFFLTSVISPVLYCDLRRLPSSMSSSPSHQYVRSSWFFKKGLWNLWSDSCNWKCPSYTWMIFWLGTQICGLTSFPWGFMCVAYLLKDILRTVWLFSSINCHGFSALIFEIISLKSSRSIILLLGLVGKQIVTFFLLKHQVLLKTAESIVFSFWSFFEWQIIKKICFFFFLSSPFGDTNRA